MHRMYVLHVFCAYIHIHVLMYILCTYICHICINTAHGALVSLVLRELKHERRLWKLASICCPTLSLARLCKFISLERLSKRHGLKQS